MTMLVISLVVMSALLHAFWNLIAKKVSGGIYFAWLLWLCSTLMLTPFAIWELTHGNYPEGILPIFLIFLSSLMHAGYFLMLQKSYMYGDLSIVYPVTRGLGPIVSVVLAIIILNERPAFPSVLGTLIITAGALLLVGRIRLYSKKEIGLSMSYSFITSLFIGGYLITDKLAVDVVRFSPLLFSWSYELGRTAIIFPVVSKNFEKVISEIGIYSRQILSMALLGTTSYLLILFAMKYGPLSYIAPARTLGIVFGTILGGVFLKEREMHRRILASSVIVAGLILLSIDSGSGWK